MNLKTLADKLLPFTSENYDAFAATFNSRLQRQKPTDSNAIKGVEVEKNTFEVHQFLVKSQAKWELVQSQIIGFSTLIILMTGLFVERLFGKMPFVAFVFLVGLIALILWHAIYQNMISDRKVLWAAEFIARAEKFIETFQLGNCEPWEESRTGEDTLGDVDKFRHQTYLEMMRVNHHKNRFAGKSYDRIPAHSLAVRMVNMEKDAFELGVPQLHESFYVSQDPIQPFNPTDTMEKIRAVKV